MNSGGDELQTFTKEGTINAEFVLTSIDTFVSSLTKITVLVLDNARIHHAKIFRDRKDKWEQEGLYIFYLPAYSPHLNRIERLWRKSKYRWIPPQSYSDLATLNQTLALIWSRFGTDYQIHFSEK